MKKKNLTSPLDTKNTKSIKKVKCVLIYYTLSFSAFKEQKSSYGTITLPICFHNSLLNAVISCIFFLLSVLSVSKCMTVLSAFLLQVQVC